MLRVLIACIAVLAIPANASAATVTWDGGSSGTWGTDTNWSGDLAPTSADDVVIENAVVTADLLSDAHARTVIVRGSTARLVLDRGTLTLAGASGIPDLGLEDGARLETAQLGSFSVADQTLEIAGSGSGAPRASFYSSAFTGVATSVDIVDVDVTASDFGFSAGRLTFAARNRPVTWTVDRSTLMEVGTRFEVTGTPVNRATVALSGSFSRAFDGTVALDDATLSKSGSGTVSIGSLDLDDSTVEYSDSGTITVAGAATASNARLTVVMTSANPTRTASQRTVLSAGTSAPTLFATTEFTGSVLPAPWILEVRQQVGKVQALRREEIAPTAPTIDDGDLVVGSPISRSVLKVTVSGATDAHSGLAGYAVVWDAAPGTIPPSVASVGDGAEGASGPLGDGAWYVHVRAVDNDGNGSTTTHAGPYIVDTTGPGAPTITGAPSGLVNRVGSVTFQGEIGASFVCTTTARPSNFACSSPFDLTQLGAGVNTLSVVAVDAAGNQGQAWASAHWTLVIPVKPVLPAAAKVVTFVKYTTGRIGKEGTVRLRIPTAMTDVAVSTRLTVTAAQAKKLGLVVKKGAKTVVLGSASQRTLGPGTQEVFVVPLSKAAKSAFKRAGAKGSKVGKVATTLEITFDHYGLTSAMKKAFVFQR